jgi:hypothetical protein
MPIQTVQTFSRCCPFRVSFAQFRVTDKLSIKGETMLRIATLLVLLGSAVFAQDIFDLSGVPESQARAITHYFSSLGIQPTGTIKDSDDTWCVFNDWSSRDQRAHIEDTFERRFSVATTFGGRWYCYVKKENR